LSVNMRDTNKQTNKQTHLNLFLFLNYSNWHTQSHTNLLRILIVLFLSFSHLCDWYIDILILGSLDKLLYDTKEHISNEKKIEWIHEIANGMCHLHKHNIVHRDLAARNILLTHSNSNGQPKISVFLFLSINQ
jgi:serine/threonine protein kinase